MTATNHAITGAVIAAVTKQPALAIPLALVSHFVVDLIPHYNPRGMTRETFKNYSENWSKKMSHEHRSFRLVFAVDGVLLILVLASAFRIKHIDVSAWTVFFSSLAAISPDLIGLFEYLCSLLFGYKAKSRGWLAKFVRFHLGLQWMERPWGVYVEMVWFVLMLSLILKIGR